MMDAEFRLADDLGNNLAVSSKCLLHVFDNGRGNLTLDVAM